MWYEQEDRYKWVSAIALGHDENYMFEVYEDQITGELVTAYHDDPEYPEPIEELVKFAKEACSNPEHKYQVEALNKILLDHGIERLLIG